MADEADKPVFFPVSAVHMMRQVQANHVQFSAIADQKASILMGASFVIFTLAIGQARGTAVPLALLILGGAAFLSAIFAFIAVIPVTRQKKSLETSNLLFFGSFAHLSEEEYTDQIVARLQSDDSIYRTMARDIYQNGMVLHRKKYRLLGYAYRIFLIGMTGSLGAFVAQYFFT